MAAPRKASPPRRRAGVIVAIDGPAGAGKSTVARGTARALGFGHLDTGSMYRAVTAEVLARGIDPRDARAVARVARSMRFGFSGRGITSGGRTLGREIRSRRVGAAVSAVSAHREVRRILVKTQRQILQRGGVVAEGRDIGTVVFPRADVKVFLTASIAERARRRLQELHRGGDAVSLTRLRKEIAHRDALDSTRRVSPLRPADDAVVMDTTRMTARQAVREIIRLVEKRQTRGRRTAPTRRGTSRKARPEAAPSKSRRRSAR